MEGISRQQSALREGLAEERVKQIALNHFYAFYVRRDVSEMIRHVDPNVRWIGSRDYFTAHNKEELRNLLQKELANIPYTCAVKVVSAEAVKLDENCYNVDGELELRVPYQTQVSYFTLRFSMNILLKKEEYSIVFIHTSMSGDGELLYGKEGGAVRQMAGEGTNQNEYDALTGLYTLDYFKKEVREILDKKGDDSQYALLCTDISHFERVNNLYGLKRADKILFDVATMLTTSGLQAELCCRSVADHFLVLVTYQTVDDLKEKLKQLCEEFGNTISDSYAEARPRLGVGVYRIASREDDIGRIVECANIARKSLRFQKGACIAFYDAKIFSRMEKVKKIERTMKQALEQKEFKVFLQPKYNLDTGRIVGAEALSRWIHEDGTAVYPDEFIPVFESNGFIVDLDFYMLNEVCRMIQKRLDQGKLCVPVSINQSRVLLNDRNYAARISAVLEKYNTPPKYIELELTERIFKEDLSDMAQIMGKLKDLGIHWSIDDFGTGYSSLNLLKELPVDIIKIDKSFLDETETSETSKVIIRKTVELTQELDKTVVCEGVETESQADYLRGIRCDVAQGYLYARPMPMEEFEQLLDEETKE